MTPRKTMPTHQYDIFWVPGKDTKIPQRSIAYSEYSAIEGGCWAIQFGGPGDYHTTSNEGSRSHAHVDAPFPEQHVSKPTNLRSSS